MKKNKNVVVAKNPDERGELLGLSPADKELMKQKAILIEIAIKSMEQSGFPVNDIVARSGVSRSKVSAVKNHSPVSVTCDLLIKIIAATGKSLKVKAA
jgi:predicted XRE-type DNA-binding protein